jgi:hypothetical protein
VVILLRFRTDHPPRRKNEDGPKKRDQHPLCVCLWHYGNGPAFIIVPIVVSPAACAVFPIPMVPPVLLEQCPVLLSVRQKRKNQRGSQQSASLSDMLTRRAESRLANQISIIHMKLRIYMESVCRLLAVLWDCCDSTGQLKYYRSWRLL